MPKPTLRILLVEDHPFQLIATQILLNNHGYFLLTPALTAAEAFTALERSPAPYDLLLCDQCLPDMPGLELIDHAWRKGLAHQAIVFSGLEHEQLNNIEQTAQQRGLPLLGCLSKPLQGADLARLIATLKPQAF